ncbi:MAG: flagellar motor protein MotA [Alphaproteobacteria bacterium]
MTVSRRYLVRMIVFIGLVAAVAGLLWQPLLTAFLTNVALNGLILFSFALGIAFVFRQVLTLRREAEWMEAFQRGTGGLSGPKPRLLAPMARMFGERKEHMRLTAPAMRSVLDSIGARLDESREISRYIIGLLIFLGLLGTFWGLLRTIGAVGGLIAGLDTVNADAADFIETLTRGLQAPLGGMGTAFSSSLFGLAGALVLGFLDLQGGQAQNRFYNELEEWLSGHTRIGGGAIGGDGETSVPAYVQALLEQTADSLEALQRTLVRGEESRIKADQRLATLGERIGSLTDSMRTEQNLMVKIAESQMALQPVLTRLAATTGQGGGFDEAARGHLRNIDVHLTRMSEELSQNRHDTMGEIRNEFRLLTRTLAALGEESGRNDA